MIHPIADYVFVKHDKKASEKEGVIFSDVTKNKSDQGIVDSAGAESELKKGMRVLFNPFQARQVHLGGEDFYILRENQIYCVIK